MMPLPPGGVAKGRLAKDGRDAIGSPRMTIVRTIIAALLVLAWLPATNSCLIAATFSDKVEDCCNPDEGQGDDGSGGTNSCDRCITMENGFPLTLLDLSALPAPLLFEIESLGDLLRALAAEVSLEIPPAYREAPPPVRALLHFVLRTAQPVRGPSVV